MPASRARLLSLLTEACELEHGLACSYLFSAFSIKQDLSEGGLDWKQLQTARLWASELYMVAAEEMLHLAQAWNILSAAGGAPYYMRPNFPQSRTYYGFDLPLALEPFGVSALRRFILYETPADQITLPPDDTLDDAPGRYRSVGELYDRISKQIKSLPEGTLFFPGAQGEMGPEFAHFPGIIPVRDTASALAAIEMITEQGEGTSCDRGDSHYAVFRRTLKALLAEQQQDPTFEPARPVLENPVPRIRGDWNSPGKVNLIRDPFASQTSDLFDDVYSLMLRLLQHAFTQGPASPTAAVFCNVAINAMTMVLKPLGEALAMMPSGRGDGSRAGASFGLTRHVSLPPSDEIAVVVASERARELAAVAAAMAGKEAAPPQLAVAAKNLTPVDRGSRSAAKGRLTPGCSIRGWIKEELERAKGIEPSYAAWEAAVLPLNYARASPVP